MVDLASALVAGQVVPQIDASTLAQLQGLEPHQIDLTNIAAGIGGSLAPYRRIVASSRGNARVGPFVGVKSELVDEAGEATAGGEAALASLAAGQMPFQQALAVGITA